jgi:hypothetical protein
VRLLQIMVELLLKEVGGKNFTLLNREVMIKSFFD